MSTVVGQHLDIVHDRNLDSRLLRFLLTSSLLSAVESPQTVVAAV